MLLSLVWFMGGEGGGADDSGLESILAAAAVFSFSAGVAAGI